MGYIFDFKDAVEYDQWAVKQCNRLAADLEVRLLLQLLKPVRGNTVLDIGCGTGESLLPFLRAGLEVTGIDPSPYMLDIAKLKVGHQVDLHRGFAEDLPFDDNSFNYASLFTTLEFTEVPQKAIEEACRVAKDKVFIGVLNKYALKAVQRRIKGLFIKSIYNRAHFFSIWELKKMIRDILGDVPISWRTVCQFPGASGNIARCIEQTNLIQKSPFGAFIGIAVTPVPRFRTTPLPLKYKTEAALKSLTGIAGGAALKESKKTAAKP